MLKINFKMILIKVLPSTIALLSFTTTANAFKSTKDPINVHYTYNNGFEQTSKKTIKIGISQNIYFKSVY